MRPLVRSRRVPTPLLAAFVAVVSIASLLVATPAEAASQAQREAAWKRSFAQLQKSLSGPASLSVGGVKHGEQAITVGTLDPGVAWSTIKIPLAMAALRRAKGPVTKARVDAALRHSDNAAAAQLWNQLGGGKTAARRVNAVLDDYGNSDVAVPSRATRAGYSSFGQTVWSVKRQSRFMRGIACNPEGAYVRRQLGAAVSGHWGLRYFDDALVKNGYGPVKGGFLVRQTALVDGSDGRRWSVSIAVRATSQARGFADATRLTQWLRQRIRQVPASRC